MVLNLHVTFMAFVQICSSSFSYQFGTSGSHQWNFFHPPPTEQRYNHQYSSQKYPPFSPYVPPSGFPFSTQKHYGSNSHKPMKSFFPFFTPNSQALLPVSAPEERAHRIQYSTSQNVPKPKETTTFSFGPVTRPTPSIERSIIQKNISPLQSRVTTAVSWDGTLPQCDLTPITLKITEGELTTIEKNPWQVAIMNKVTKKVRCGGTLISQRHVITAAHCFSKTRRKLLDQPDIRKRLGVAAGYTDLEDSNLVYYNITHVYIHSKFSGDVVRNDIALIFLRELVPPSDQISPICLPRSSTIISEGAMCTITGWGVFNASAIPRITSRFLMGAMIDILPDIVCENRYKQFTKGMICAGSEIGKDTCQGDSGGPLICVKDEIEYLYGVTSYGKECGEKSSPGVYTKIIKYLDWINQRLELTKNFREGDDDPTMLQDVDVQ